MKLKDRIKTYQQTTDYRLLPKLPIIMIINGRGFFKLTSMLEKPYDKKFAECMKSTLMRLCIDVEGAVFGYQYNDEIVIVLRNDQNIDTQPWYDNKIQKLCSISSGLSSVHFNDCASALDLNLDGDPLFTSEVFTVPNLSEIINTLIYKQQNNFFTSIQFACIYELSKKYNDNQIKELLSGTNKDEKIDLLQQEVNVNFNKYSQDFRRGTACYKIPQIINDNVKNKWELNEKLPIFTKDQSFLSNIIKNGADIFRY